MTKMTNKEMISAMKNMDNGERLEFLDYLYTEHFNYSSLEREDVLILRAFRDNALNLEGVDLDEYDY